jgi:hypothetical protein
MLAGQLYWQTKKIYPPLIEEVAGIYSADPTAFPSGTTRDATTEEAVANLGYLIFDATAMEDAAKGLAEEINSEFGQNFLTEIITQALKDNAPALLVGSVPVIGTPVSAGVAAALAQSLTWRVGLTVAVYFLNGGAFPVSRKETVKVLKQKVIPRKPSHHMYQGVFDDVIKAFPSIGRRMVDAIATEVDELASTGRSLDEARRGLLDRGFPEYAVDQALSKHQTAKPI